jgi:hypothetical protein
MKRSDDITPELIQAFLKSWDMDNKDEIINKRVETLFRDWRFAWLLREWEMFDTLFKLERETNEVIISHYLDILEYHIDYVDPHVKIVTVNDEEEPVFFLTKILEGI